MKISIKVTRTKITPAVRERIDKICERLERLANIPDSEALECDVEVEKMTAHHRKGNVYRAEVNFTAAGRYFRAVAEGETVTAALDLAHDEIKHEFVHSKHKTQSRMRREGARMKDPSRREQGLIDE